MSLTEMVSSLIWRSRRMTSRCRKNISASSLYHLSKYCWQIFFKSSTEAFSMSALVRRRVRSFFLRSGVINPFFLAMMSLSLDLCHNLGGLLAEKSTELLLTLGGHKSLLLGHDESVLGSV